MEKIINELFNTTIKDFDVYTHEGSLWVIFVNEKKWVFELSKDGTLWYNYGLFKGLFGILSMNVIENEKYITNWFIDVILKGLVEDTIQNGVKHTLEAEAPLVGHVEDTIQNGVKHTIKWKFKSECKVEDTIQNGVKHTCSFSSNSQPAVEDTIQNGVKRTSWVHLPKRYKVEDTIQNGVKYTHHTKCIIQNVI